jgi:hypothetical protein
MDARKRESMTRSERIATMLMAVLVSIGLWQSYSVLLLEERDGLPLRVESW